MADTGGVGCTQYEYCIVEGGVPHSEKLEDRGLADKDARKVALSKTLIQWRVKTCEENTYLERGPWCRPRQVSDAEEAGRRGTGRAEYTLPARSASMETTSRRAPSHVSLA